MLGTEKFRIFELLAPVLYIDGIELVDVEAHGKTLRLLIHKPGKLSIADCKAVNQVVHPILEVHQFLATYTQFEVASPGIDRALKTAADFQRNRGKTVRIETLLANEELESGICHANTMENGVVLGSVQDVLDGTVTLLQSDGKSVRVELSCIRQAYIQLDW